MTKRISSLFLAALVMLSLATTAFAAPSVSGVGIVVDRSGSGSTVTVTVSLTDAAGATNGRIELEYDPSLYTISGSDVEPANSQWITSVNLTESGKVYFAWIASVLPSEKTPLVTMKFHVIDTSGSAGTVGAFSATAEELYEGDAPIIDENTEKPTDTLPGYKPDAPSRPSEPSKPSEPDEPSKPDEPTPENPNPFEDIEDNWAKDVILEAYKNGWIIGTTDTTYEPGRTADRAQFATIMYRVAGEPGTTAVSPFTDVVPGSYYETPVNWGHEIGMIKGTSDTTAAPERNITRQEAVVMLYRYAGYINANVSGRGSLSEFLDQDSVADWARDAVEWAVSNGIIQGTPGKLLEPARDINRSEMAAIIVRFTAMT